MSYRELLPPLALRPYVDRFWLRVPGAESRASSAARDAAGALEPGEVALDANAAERSAPSRILPDGCIDVLLDADTGAARVVGTMTRAVIYEAPASRLAAVRFRPGGAYPFLRVGSAELTDRVEDVAALGARWLELGAGDPSQLVSSLALALLRRDAPGIDRRVAEASRRLFAARPPCIADLSRSLDVSRQQLTRLFRQHVGLAPKELARVARLQRALHRLQLQPSLSLAAAALAVGYYDQAHMTVEFNHLAGVTPLGARRARGSISPIPSLWMDAG